MRPLENSTYSVPLRKQLVGAEFASKASSSLGNNQAHRHRHRGETGQIKFGTTSWHLVESAQLTLSQASGGLA